jgi:hypothetical protein
MNHSSIPDHERLDDNVTTSYLPDLERLTHNPNDEVKMTMTAYKTLVKNIGIINQNILKNSESLASIRRRNDVNEELALEMESIISSLKPKKKAKFSTKQISFQTLNLDRQLRSMKKLLIHLLELL